MRLGDLSIGARLSLGLGAVFAAVLLLGGVSWHQGTQLWNQTRRLYEHPLMVRRAIGELRYDVLVMHRAMKDLVLADTQAERDAAIDTVNRYESSAYKQVDVLDGLFLGSKVHVEDIRRCLEEWKSERDISILLARSGETAAALARSKPKEPGGAKVDELLSEIDHVSAYSIREGDQLYVDARTHRGALLAQLAAIIGAALLLTAAAGVFLTRSIRRPVAALTDAATRYRRGERDARSGYRAGNEFGALSAAFDSLADQLDAENARRASADAVAETVVRENDLRGFCRGLLVSLMTETDSQVGAVFIADDEGAGFSHFESVGLSEKGKRTFDAASLEGELGLAIATGQVRRIAEIPESSQLTFRAAVGDFRPREILTIPILSEGRPLAVVSLASLSAYSDRAIRLAEDVHEVVAARMGGVRALEMSRKLTERLWLQNDELESQKRELEEANRHKNAFLSNVSHELRTPLNSVIALSGVLSRRLANTVSKEDHGYLEVIERNGKNLLALIEGLLDLSRIEAGREDISSERFSVVELVDQVVATVAPMAAEKGVSLRAIAPETDLAVVSDAAKCRHILENLIGNAVKFTEEGSVTVSVGEAKNGVFVAVRDTGIGIPADELPHVFDEFRRAGTAASRRIVGTGLGLAIARRYAELLGGRIEVDSAYEGGSTFTLWLPSNAVRPEIPTGESSRGGLSAGPEDTDVA